MTDTCVIDTEIPLVLVFADDASTASLSCRLLERSGWRVEVARCAKFGGETARNSAFSVVLLNISDDAVAAETALAIRKMPGFEAAGPILRIINGISLDSGSNLSGVDAQLAGAPDYDSLARSLEHWRPFSLAPTRRIAEMFGSGPIAGMIERLARRLEAAMIRLDQGSFDKAEAHRLAGLCGTLGFGQTHAAWLDLSLGEETAREEVRRTTRLTLAAIARGL